MEKEGTFSDKERVLDYMEDLMQMQEPDSQKRKRKKGEEKLGGLAIDDCGVLGEAKWKYCQG